MSFAALLLQTVLVATVSHSAAAKKVLFLGNSHTANNNVPDLVKQLAASGSRPLSIEVKYYTAGHLNDFSQNSDVETDIRTNKYDFVVLQAAMVSMSHKNTYPQDGGIALAKAAESVGSKVLMYPEWSREGIDETEYTEAVYRGIAAQTRTGKTAPVGQVWDEVRRRWPLPLWLDGNHANLDGSFLAANVLYRWIVYDDKPVTTWRPPAVTRDKADLFQLVTVDFFRKLRDKPGY